MITITKRQISQVNCLSHFPILGVTVDLATLLANFLGFGEICIYVTRIDTINNIRQIKNFVLST